MSETATITVTCVRTSRTRDGRTAWHVLADSGEVYSTLRPEIGNRAYGFEGLKALVSFSPKQNGPYLNRYLEGIS